ncbi:hypothetical protein PCANB_001922 [Pneumocystis canis]|nr:hypothetical protein PCK1_001710 [Pneumocystis canis]KAG5440352.1 hypothetical protein PCANB_001922 [Pneumocystis canis]
MRFCRLSLISSTRFGRWCTLQIRWITDNSGPLTGTSFPQDRDAFKKREKVAEDLYIKKREEERLKSSLKDNLEKKVEQNSFHEKK